MYESILKTTALLFLSLEIEDTRVPSTEKIVSQFSFLQYVPKQATCLYD